MKNVYRVLKLGGILFAEERHVKGGKLVSAQLMDFNILFDLRLK